MSKPTMRMRHHDKAANVNIRLSALKDLIDDLMELVAVEDPCVLQQGKICSNILEDILIDIGRIK